MKRFVEGVDRSQSTLFPDRLEDWIGDDNAVRVIDVFVDELDLGGLSFGRAAPRATGRPGYHPSDLLKLYIYGYLNRVQSSRRLEREAGRNVEVMWLTGRLVPDHKTIADFRKDNGGAIRKIRTRFVALCRHRPADRGDEGGIGARPLQFAPVSGQIAAYNGNPSPRARISRTKPQNLKTRLDGSSKPTSAPHGKSASVFTRPSL